MDIELAARAAHAAERIPSMRSSREALVRYGSTASWLHSVEGRQLVFSNESVGRTGLQVAGAHALAWEDPGYPEGLRHLSQPPPALFVRGPQGALPAPERCVAVIGARRCTESGRAFARDLAGSLARAGVVVVSGLAMGIDTAAHEGALDVGGETLAVLASAVNEPTPRRNVGLADEILDAGGWLLSERPPGASVRAFDFPRRNRLVAALVQLVVVVEAGLRSGTLSTVGHALDLGVDVAAVPGPATSPASAGAHELIRRGAHLVTSSVDVLPLLGRRVSRSCNSQDSPADEDAASVLNGLPGASGTLDQWVVASDLPRARAIASVHRLLVGGVLRRLPGGRIARVL
jgi:DNA processing protein